MEVLSKEELLLNKERYIEQIKKGALFIHPTDTIYGIGCIATQSRPVNNVRKVKKRDVMPFSIMVPSKDWIHKNCLVPKHAEEWIDKLPGPYTLIFKIKKGNHPVAKEVNNEWDSIGVRIPNHWFADFVKELGFPIITTSANISGEDFMTSLENLHPEIKVKMDFIVYEGEKKGYPSTIVNLSKEKTEIVSRSKEKDKK